MSDRDTLITMGFGEAEVDQYLRECRADAEAFQEWWNGLSRLEKRTISEEVAGETLAAIQLEIANPEEYARREVYARHGFQYPFGNPCPRLSKEQAERYIELIADDTTMMERPRLVPFKRKP